MLPDMVVSGNVTCAALQQAAASGEVDHDLWGRMQCWVTIHGLTARDIERLRKSISMTRPYALSSCTSMTSAVRRLSIRRHFFISRKGQRLTVRSVERLVKKYAIASGAGER